MSAYIETVLASMEPPWVVLAAKVLEDCRNPPNAVDTPEEFYPGDDEIDKAAFLIRTALDDCIALDCLEKSDYFTNRFERALSSPVAWAGVMWWIRQPLDGRKSEASTEALLIKSRIRERVMDGLALSDALSEISSWLENVAHTGNIEFFSRDLPRCLEQIQTKPHLYSNRSLKDWVRRAWIPLGLWLDVSDSQNVHTVLQRAAKLLNVGHHLDWPSFYSAWTKTKPTKVKAK